MTISKQKELDYAQQDVINEILQSLSENKIPWQKPWKTYKPLNAISKRVYNGTNSLLLQLKDFSDPRWATFKQANEQGWKIKKGSKGSYIQHIRVYDPETNEDITNKSFEKLSAEEVVALKERIRTSKKSYKVFNAEQIEGIPELLDEDKKEVIFNNNAAQEYSNNLFQKTGIILSPGSKASYTPAVDQITMPSKELFLDEPSYYATLMHEFGHATGHETRLDRKLIGHSISHEDQYAYEELVAELNSVIISMDMGLQLDQNHIDTHKAYCQSWHDCIKADNSAFFRALKDAQLAREYLLKTGEYDKFYNNDQSIVVDKDTAALEVTKKKMTIDQMKNSVSIVDYAAEVLGLSAIKETRGLISFEQHDSCKVYPNNTYYRFSSSRGGSIIDFISEFEDVDDKEAINRLRAYCEENNIEGSQSYDTKSSFKAKSKSMLNQIEIPPKDLTTKNVFAYLTKTRCIKPEIVSDYMSRHILYQDENRNCVWVGKVEDKIMYATKRSSSIGSNYKGDVQGSFKEVGIYIDNQSTTLIVNEAPIDQMSYMSMAKDPKEFNYLSVCGAANAVNSVKFHLLKRDEAKSIDKIIIALDNDEAGESNTLSLNEYLKENHPNIHCFVHLPNSKDFNEDLQLQVKGEISFSDELTQKNELDAQRTMGQGMDLELKP